MIFGLYQDFFIVLPDNFPRFSRSTSGEAGGVSDWLILSAALIAKTTYPLAPPEMKELSMQL